MKLISLSQGKFAMVDDEDFEFLNQFKWNAKKDGNDFYAARTVYLTAGSKRGKFTTIKMHRLIMKTPEGMEVDHIHHNTLDNRKSELRNCTRSQNNMNRTKKKNCSSKYLGVCWHKARKKWRARININGKEKHIGLYQLEIEAAKSYDKMAIKHHIEFANLNFK